MKARDYLIVLIVILAIVLLWNGVMWLFHRPTTPKNSVPISSIAAGNHAAESLFASGPVFAPGLVQNGRGVIGLTDLGRFFTKIDLVTKQVSQLLPDAIGFVPDWVSYAPDGHAAIAHQDATNLTAAKTTLFDFVTKQRLDLNPAIDSVAWQGDSQQIYYMYRDADDTQTLAKANPDGSAWHILVEKVALTDPVIHLSPSGKQLLASRAFIGFDPDERDPSHPVEIINLEPGTVDKVPLEGAIADPLWSPDGKKIAFVRIHDDLTRQFGVYDLATLKETPINLETAGGKFAWRSATELVLSSFTSKDLTHASIKERFWSVTTDGSMRELSQLTNQPPVTDLAMIDQGKSILFRRDDYLFRETLPSN